MYNQLKMYSEIWRMLGWLHSGEQRLRFRTTELGTLIAEAEFPLRSEDQALLQELFISITFPNPQTENRGIDNLRPFAVLLLLMDELDGRITRDEMILSLYAVTDDRQLGALPAAVDRVKAVRGRYGRLEDTLTATCAAEGVQVNTARNYTRIPIGVLTDANVSWASERTDRATYGRCMKFFELTEHGREVVARLKTMTDVRLADMAGFSIRERAAFLNVGHFAMLDRAGFEAFPQQDEFLAYCAEVAGPILARMSIASAESVLFSPFQQATASEITAADAFESSWRASTN
jgi:hypothetical protein